MTNHDLELLDSGHHRCRVCEVSWSFLSATDVEMLSTRGRCIGRPEHWHRCEVTAGMWCLGGDGHPDCVLLESSEKVGNRPAPKKCSHAITHNLRKVIVRLPADEQASPIWDWARDCSTCGETIIGTQLD